VVETCFHQRLQPLLVQSQAGGDEIGIESGGARGRDEFRQIRARQRFAAGEMRMQHSQLPGLLKNIRPLCRRKFRLNRGKFHRIRAIDAVQRAAVRDFGDQS